MKRNVSIDEISDGRLYGPEDMVRVGCDDCSGCSACCRNMGTSAILDPMDIYRLTKVLNNDFTALLAGPVELNVVDGIILPNLKMTGNPGRCGFLNKQGRCTVHSARPGICRCFPLGRYYDNGGFKYFLQIHECKKEKRTKIKVKKWLDTPDLSSYERYINDWHNFLMDLEADIEAGASESAIKNISMVLLECFYMKSYDTASDFYPQFYERLKLLFSAKP